MDVWGKGTMVTVTSATAIIPTVFPLTPCGNELGSTVTVGCLATGFTPSSVTFSWTLNGVALDSVQYPSMLSGNTYTGISQIQVSRQDWTKEKIYKCKAKNTAGEVEKNVEIVEPFYKDPELKVLANSEDKVASFVCVAENFSPKHYDIQWLLNNKEISGQISEIRTQTEGQKTENGTVYSATSFLTLPSKNVPTPSKLTCRFKGKNAAGDKTTDKPFTYNPCASCGSTGCMSTDADIHIEEPSLEDLFLNLKGSVICLVNIRKPVTKVYWEDENGNKMASSSVVPDNQQSSVVLPLDITYNEWSQGIKYFCVVQGPNILMKKAFERNIERDIQSPSVFMMTPVENTKKETVTLTCYVKDFYPKEVLITWLVNDQAVNPTHDFNTTSPIESNDGSYSAYGHMSLSFKEWHDNDMVYSCAVYHQSVVNNTNKVIIRSVGYKTFEKINMVNLSLNIPDKCTTQ